MTTQQLSAGPAARPSKIQIYRVTRTGIPRFESLPKGDIAQFLPVTQCPACNASGNFQPVAYIGGASSEEALGLVLCEDCGHVTYNRIPSESQLEHYYNQIWDRAGRKQDPLQYKIGPFFGFPWDYFHDLALPKSSKILDFGCGYGNGMLCLQSMGYENIYGVELGEQRVRVASRYFPGRVKGGSVTEAYEFGKEHGPFDLVVVHHILEHLRNPYETIKNLVPLLAPGGKILIAVPDIYTESPVYTALYFAHLHLFNTASLMRLVKRAGLFPFKWKPGQSQLVLVASLAPDWKPESGNFTHEEPAIDKEFTSKLAGYIQAPWKLASSNKIRYLFHFHSYRIPQYPQGYMPLDPPANLWFGWARNVLARLSFLDQRRFVFRVFFLAIAKKIFGEGKIPGDELVGIKGPALRDGGIPWITLPSGDMPILVK